MSADHENDTTDVSAGTYVYQAGSSPDQPGQYVYQPPPAIVVPPIVERRLPTYVSLNALTGLGTAVTVLLSLIVLADGWDIVVVQRLNALVQKAVAGADISTSEITDIDRAGAQSQWTYLALLVAAGVPFLIWFWRVRDNAGGLRPDLQHRSQGWAIGGWFCPIVNLWFPCQIAVDAVHSSAVPGPDRPSAVLVRIWWGLLLASGVLGRVSVAYPSETLDDIRRGVLFSQAANVVNIAAAIAAILVVRQLTALLDKNRYNDVGELVDGTQSAQPF